MEPPSGRDGSSGGPRAAGALRRAGVVALALVGSVVSACGGDDVDFDTPEMPDQAPTMAPDPPEMDLEPPGG